MKRTLFAVSVLLLSSTALHAADTINWKDADKYYGQHKIVEGTIVATKCTPKVCYLNFDPNWQKYFTAVIFASDLHKFPASPDSYFLNKKVRITGTIEEYKGKPEIILKSPSQISVTK